MNPVVICYCCRQRIAEDEIQGGIHNHLDVEEQEAARVFAQYAGQEAAPANFCC